MANVTIVAKAMAQKRGQVSRLGGLRGKGKGKPPQSVMDDGAQLRRSLYFVVLSCLVCYFLESRAHYVVAAAIILLSTPDTHTRTHRETLLHPRVVKCDLLRL